MIVRVSISARPGRGISTGYLGIKPCDATRKDSPRPAIRMDAASRFRALPGSDQLLIRKPRHSLARSLA
jgi:hypothetical protein